LKEKNSRKSEKSNFRNGLKRKQTDKIIAFVIEKATGLEINK
jgi:hypothetical protein